MFGISKDRLCNSLQMIRKKLCSYSHQPCDCKYINDNMKASDICNGHENGSGCPEVSMAYAIINAMTDSEFNKICDRTKISTLHPQQSYVDNGKNVLKEELNEYIKKQIKDYVKEIMKEYLSSFGKSISRSIYYK